MSKNELIVSGGGGGKDEIVSERDWFCTLNDAIKGNTEVSRPATVALLKMCRRLFSDEVEEDLVHATDQALEACVHLIMLYTLFCWLLFCPKAYTLIVVREDRRFRAPKVAVQFRRILHRQELHLLHGRTPNGEQFTRPDVPTRKPQMVVMIICSAYTKI